MIGRFLVVIILALSSVVFFSHCDGGGSFGGDEGSLEVITSKLEFGPATLPGGNRVEPVWAELGFLIESDYMTSHSLSESTFTDGFWPSNGTDYLRFTSSVFGSGFIQVTRTDGSEFGVTSVDLAEYSDVFPVPKSVTFIGTKGDGSQVSITFITDGTITGQGSDVDFEVFIFPESFNDLVLLECPDGIFALDNLVLTTPINGSI